MKAHLYCLIEEKQEAIKKLQKEVQLLLLTYHCLPTEEEVLCKQKQAYEEYMTNFSNKMENE